MPVITVQFIKDVVATPEQKRELLIRLTNAFIGIVGEVTRPFVYCIIKETPQGEWSIAGVPMPDLVYLTSPQHAQVIDRSNNLMRAAVAQMQQQQPQTQQAQAAPAPAAPAPAAVSSQSREDVADKVWRGALSGVSGGSTENGAHGSDADADTIWRGGTPKAGVKRNSPNNSGAGSSAADYPHTQEELVAKLKAEAAEAESKRIVRNRDVIDRFYSALNSKHREEIKQLVHPNFVNHGGSAGDLVGSQALIDSLNPFYEAMPDWHLSEDYVVAQGDRVAARGTISGTHLGSFMGAPPSGKKVSWTGIIIYRLDENGKIVERWQDFDAMSMLQQLGVIPPMG